MTNDIMTGEVKRRAALLRGVPLVCLAEILTLPELDRREGDAGEYGGVGESEGFAVDAADAFAFHRP